MAKILIADDSDMMRKIAKMTIEKGGYQVVEASNGAQAVELAQKELPQLILLDAEMPEMDGWEASKAIKANPATSSIPVLLCTGHDLSGEEDQLKESGISYKMLENAFIEIQDWERANEIVKSLKVEELHNRLNAFASKYCPVYKSFNQLYHWSIMQCEYSTDIVFKNKEDLQGIYGKLIQTAVHTVKPEHIVSFLGKKLSPLYKGELGNQYHVRLEGTCIKHVMGKTSIKMYDKFAQILRIETTSNEISFFKHYREVIHRDGSRTEKVAAMKKNIYSLTALLPIMQASNRRYLEFISAIEDEKVGKDKLEKITRKVTVEERNYRGFNFFDKNDEKILQIIARGEFNIFGFRAKHLKQFSNKSSSQISRILKRLHVHGLIKKIKNSYKYYLTDLGKEAILVG